MEYYSIEDFAVTLEGEYILSDINLNIQYESIVGIVGEKDSGKSLLVHALTSEKTYASKDIKIKNEPIYFPANLVKSDQLIENNTASKNLRLLTAQNELLTDADIEWCLEKVGLGLNDDRLIRDYTKAEKYLLAVAIVLSNHPKIILLDAPFKSFEIVETPRLYSLIKQLNRMNITILMMERNRALLDPICNEIYEMKEKSLKNILV